MSEQMLSYDEIVDHFSEEAIGDRYRFLYDKMQGYIKERKLETTLYINDEILQRVIMDYYSDIYRLKTYHKIDRINKAKIIAHEIFWIIRRKPMQLLQKEPDSTRPDNKLAFSNEGFCTTLIANELLTPNETMPLPKDAEDLFMEFMDHLYYTLKYRIIDQQSLEAIVYAFQVSKLIHDKGGSKSDLEIEVP